MMAILFLVPTAMQHAKLDFAPGGNCYFATATAAVQTGPVQYLHDLFFSSFSRKEILCVCVCVCARARDTWMMQRTQQIQTEIQCDTDTSNTNSDTLTQSLVTARLSKLFTSSSLL